MNPNDWTGRRVELERKRTGETREGVITKDNTDGPTLITDDSGNVLSAYDWHYRPAAPARPAPAEKEEA